MKITLVIASLFATAAFADDRKPLPGLWLISAIDAGLPMGGGKQSLRVCIDAARLESGFERAFMEALPRKGPRRGAGPACSYAKVARKEGASTWGVNCRTPFGDAPGSGAGEYSTLQFVGRQSNALSGPMGRMEIVRTVSAKRLGDCEDQDEGEE